MWRCCCKSSIFDNITVLSFGNQSWFAGKSTNYIYRCVFPFKLNNLGVGLISCKSQYVIYILPTVFPSKNIAFSTAMFQPGRKRAETASEA